MKKFFYFIYDRFDNGSGVHKILENISWLLFDKILRLGVGLFVGLWIARYLGPEQFGILSFSTAFVGLFSAFAVLGLQGVVVRDIVRDPTCAGEILGTAVILQLFGGLFSYGLILLVSFYIRPDDPVTRSVICILGSIMLFKSGEIAIYWFESQVLSKFTVWVQNSVFVIFAMIKVALIINNFPVTVFAWAIFGEALLVAMILFLALHKYGKSLFSLRFRLNRAGKLLKSSWPLIISAVAINIYMKIDQIMLGQLAGDKAVGIYSAATRISEIWFFIPTAIIASFFPYVLKLKELNEKQYYCSLQSLYDFVVSMSIVVATFMTFFSSPIVTILFGDAYKSAGAVLSIHVWSSLFVFMGVVASKWHLGEDRQVLGLQRTIVGAIINIALNAWLIPIYGINGAALTTVISYAMAAFVFDFVQKETRKMFFMKLSAMNPLAVYFRFRRRKNTT